jgi:hypothetical protein
MVAARALESAPIVAGASGSIRANIILAPHLGQIERGMESL